MAQEANRSIADDAANKAKQAVKVAKDTAKAAQAVGKAASKAAQGRYAEAAFDLLKNETTRKIIVIMLLVGTLLPIIAMMALPSMLFGSIMEFLNNVAEAISNFFEAIGEWFDNLAKTFKSYLESVAGVVVDILCDLFGVAKPVTDENANKDDINNMPPEKLFAEYVDDNEGNVMYSGDAGLSTPEERQEAINAGDDAVYDTIDKKLNVTAKKLRYRMREIRNAIRGVQYVTDDATYEGEQAIRVVVNRYLRHATTDSAIKYQNAPLHEVQVSIEITDFEPENAIPLLSLYTSMTGADLRDVDLLTLANWLGYKEQLVAVRDGPAFAEDGQFHVMNIEVFRGGGYSLTTNVQGLMGTFMPSYLVEQRQLEKKYILQKYLDMGEDAFVTALINTNRGMFMQLYGGNPEAGIREEIREQGSFRAYLENVTSKELDKVLDKAYAQYGIGAMDLLIEVYHPEASDIVVSIVQRSMELPPHEIYARYDDLSFEYEYSYVKKQNVVDDEGNVVVDEEGNIVQEDVTVITTATLPVKTPDKIQGIATRTLRVQDVPNHGEFIGFTSKSVSYAKSIIGYDERPGMYDGLYNIEELSEMGIDYHNTNPENGKYIVVPVGDGLDYFVTLKYDYICIDGNYFYKSGSSWVLGTRYVNVDVAEVSYQIAIGVRDPSVLSTVVGLWTDRSVNPEGGTTTAYD